MVLLCIYLGYCLVACIQHIQFATCMELVCDRQCIGYVIMLGLYHYIIDVI